MDTQQKIFYFFEESKALPATLFRGFIIFLILLSAGFAVLGFLNPALLAPYHYPILYFEYFALGVFTIEYLARLSVSPSKLKFILDKFNLIDLAAILPFYLGFSNVNYLRIFRLLRLFRLLKFISVYNVFKFRGTIFEKITPLVLILVVLKVAVWIAEFEGYWLSGFDLTILFTIVGFALGIVLSQKISTTYEKYLHIERTLFSIQGKVSSIAFYFNALKEGSGNKAVKIWLEKFLEIYNGDEEGSVRKLVKINEELYKSALALGNEPLIPHHRLAALLSSLFEESTIILARKGSYTPEVYDRLLQQITLIYLVALVIFIPGLTGLLSVVFASYMLYGMYYVTRDLDIAAGRSDSSLIRLRPIKLENYLNTLK